ncbi:glycosyl hydrolase family 18 protein [Curtobacterium sp. 458]|uniref:glycosyl hydrolase family 18 protein n=1 Tax=Curtobacterium sp. 458 TaxID=3050069 RepID=UPI0025B5EC28|nr:glycosyl hydrolase family 18 protein [Curtobacterium sp. 458]WJY01843.1 glycosyl hydrolase family 18 protein [Curtobacterium sp. 458]
MVRRGITVAAVLLAGVLLAGCSSDPSVAAGRLAVEGYVEPGSGAAGRVTAAADRASTIGIDGVTLADDGATLLDPPDGTAALARTATRAGSSPELLVSNFSSDLGDFSPQIGTALLSRAAHRSAVAAELARRAHDLGVRGVQIDLESLRARDRAGLVAFAGELSDAVHDRLGRGARVSIAVMASTDADGYRDTGYDLRRLVQHVDRVVLMTYDQHGLWSGPGAIGSLPWTERVVRVAEAEGVPRSRIDLGIAGYGYVWGGEHDGEQVTPARAAELAGKAATWSARDGEWSAVLRDGVRVHWSDARSYRARVALATTLRLHGVALWSLNLEALPRT